MNALLPSVGQACAASAICATGIDPAEVCIRARDAGSKLEKKIDGCRTAYGSALAANSKIPETRQAAIQQVDAIKKNARAQFEKGSPCEGATPT